MKVLIVTTDPNKSGGVANYYKTLLGRFSFDVEYFIQGSRTDKDGFLNDVNRLISDYKAFRNKLTQNKYDLILLNPSMDFKSIVRDARFIQLSKKYSAAKLVLFWRGFLMNFFDNYIKKRFNNTFAKIFFKADAHIVLSSKFKTRLQSIGCTTPIYCESTIVSNDLLRKAPKKFVDSSFNILFLARVLKTKGIYEALNAFVIVKKKYPSVRLTIAGDGFELAEVKKYVSVNNITEVVFLGDVRGEKKLEALENADVYLFPSYFEGMPNSVLEAMGMGLPVVTTDVGGLCDFFVNEKMGYITDTPNPANLAELIEKVFANNQLKQKISEYNTQFARENFSLDVVLKRLENILNETNALKA